ncbi:MAG: hypothetical protein LBC74_07315 [Planctomycetaceae bacterium]|nr:hypothetical protein [Planctomycetaceae bacterium]
MKTTINNCQIFVQEINFGTEYRYNLPILSNVKIDKKGGGGQTLLLL